MKFEGTIVSVHAKVDHSGNIVERVVLEVQQGTMAKVGQAMRLPLMIELLPSQLEIGADA